MTWTVHKFGGSSLADARGFERAAGIVLGDSSPRVAVVVSAMQGVTNALFALLDRAVSGDEKWQDDLDALQEQYSAVSEELISDPERRAALLEAQAGECRNVADILHSAVLIQSAGPRMEALVSGCGELWSARLLAALISERGAVDGRKARWLDARDVLRVEPGELGVVVDWETSGRHLKRLLENDDTPVRVVTGYIARDGRGLQITLGRNGSDFSASIFSALLGAESLTIWTDVEGVMSADPARVPEAHVIRELSYNEAMELAYFGARVIHPQTMGPVISKKIPVWIRSSFRPELRGSLISADGDRNEPVKGITMIENVTMLSLEGSGMIGVPGTADRLFNALSKAQVSVLLITQASSEHSITFAVPAAHADRAESVTRDAFAQEMGLGQVSRVTRDNGVNVLALVGDGMVGIPGVAGRFFGVLGRAGVNVIAIAQGSSERNISAVVTGASATRALRAAHGGFYLSHTTLSLGVIGVGTVGAELLDQMARATDRLRENFNLDFRVRAIANSSRMHLAPRSLDLDDWRSVLENEGEAMDLERFSEHVNPDHLPHAAIVDCTASESISDGYADFFRSGIHVVTPNKRAQSAPQETYERLHELRRANGVHLLYETNVGAGLPVIETLRDLIATGDEVLSVEGIFSGTLAYLFNALDTDSDFSKVVRQARDAGYTEPDPREDLSGMDVARKLLILARELNLRMDLADVEVESLAPEELSEATVEEFLDGLGRYDGDMRRRLEQAAENSCVLRYVGRLDSEGRASVRLESLPEDHLFARLDLTSNMFLFRTARYSDSPLVVQGPGAGPEVTAGGIFADLLRLARMLGAPR
ncbi:MAG: bifunctional aspartate kinase/homoserine dehydrogenase I [Gammaproteobacteria bacterium]|nr:bifunctional aspartate kinase/homoserine dehydrogenase I [Gammaproteobacteria bacterium]MYF67202.1 bifunctional aspartate kinase/homoserine dehydrogenase I [Gammaproteobacteria bacterium]MYK36635.1 bifunctional aspartate kinase/homoserine dehydrogenase I [Gammaproteobacteria bacterium]